MQKRELIPNILVEYAPQKRTIFSRCRAYVESYDSTFFLQFPHVLFLKQSYDGSNLLYCAFSDKALTETSYVCLPWMQNVYDLGRVCLRSSYGASLKDLVNLFWNQIFNFDGPYGIPVLLGMFGEVKTLSDFKKYNDDINLLGSEISKALLNWQNASYDEIVMKMNEPTPPVTLELHGSERYPDNPSFKFKWKFSDWLDAVCRKHHCGPSLKDVKFDAEYKVC